MPHTILDSVLEHCASRHWTATLLPDRPVVEVSFDLRWVQWNAFVMVEDDVIAIRSRYPSNVPTDRRRSVAEYLTRADSALVVGSFELDWRDGETRFRTSLDLNGAPFDDVLLEALFDANTQGYRRYVRGLAAVIAGTVDPEAAIADAESD